MIEKNEAIRTLVKNISGTMDAAGMVLQTRAVEGQKERDPLHEEGKTTAVLYQGPLGSVRLEFADGLMKVLCGRGEEEYQEVSTSLFENDAEKWNQKDLRSAGNEVMDSVSSFFNTPIVYEEGGKGKKSETSAAGTRAVAEKADVPAKKKKKKKRAGDEYECIDLAYRLESIYQDTRGKADENIDQYGRFLPEEYFAGVMTPLVIESIRTEDRPVLKRLFRAFNTFYDEGEKDAQSLITVSILGVNMVQDDTLYPVCEPYMSETLQPAVYEVVRYLKKGTARKMNKYNNPKPYKPTAKERAQKNALESLGGGK